MKPDRSQTVIYLVMLADCLVMAVVLATLMALCSGCTGMSKVAKELAKDDATVTVNIGSVYGTAKIIRTNPRSDQDVTIAPDGTVTIKGHPPGIPATVVR